MVFSFKFCFRCKRIVSTGYIETAFSDVHIILWTYWLDWFTKIHTNNHCISLCVQDHLNKVMELIGNAVKTMIEKQESDIASYAQTVSNFYRLLIFFNCGNLKLLCDFFTSQVFHVSASQIIVWIDLIQHMFCLAQLCAIKHQSISKLQSFITISQKKKQEIVFLRTFLSYLLLLESRYTCVHVWLFSKVRSVAVPLQPWITCVHMYKLKRSN